MAYCTKDGCNRAYCFGNLFRQFDEDPFTVLSKLEGYTCPVCRGICNCGACRKRKDQIGYEPKLRSVGINPKLVADLRSVESLVGSGRTNYRVPPFPPLYSAFGGLRFLLLVCSSWRLMTVASRDEGYVDSKNPFHRSRT